MRVRRAAPADRSVAEAIWDYCFEKKTDPFFRFYFDECWRPEETLLLETATGVAAAVHLRRYRLRVRGVVCPVTYIVGLATHPAARGKGYARELLAAAMAETEREGCFANILMPSAAGFYQPQGWELYCHQWRRRVELAKWQAPAGNHDAGYALLTLTSDTKPLAALYDAFTARFSGYAVRDAAAWERWLHGCLAEGYVVVAYADGAPAGYMAYSIADGVLLAGETVWRNEAGREALLRYMYGHRDHVRTAVYQAPLDELDWLYWPDGAEQTFTENRTLPFMTVRPAALAAWWQRFPAAEGEVVIALREPDGSVAKWQATAAGGALQVKATTAPAAVEVAAADWAVLLIGRVNASDLRRAGRLAGTDAAVARLDAMYPRQAVWINEWY